MQGQILEPSYYINSIKGRWGDMRVKIGCQVEGHDLKRDRIRLW